MERARHLAEQAVRIAAGLTATEVESFEWQGTPDSGVYTVTLSLKDGQQRSYTVIERLEDAPGGESSP